MMFTRLGFRMRVVGGNVKAAKHSGIFVERAQFLTLIAGGAIAGLAGMIEVSGIEGHLRPMTGVGYGYIGFLVAWMAGNHPLWILPFALLIGAISVGGNALEMHSGLTSSIVLILMGFILVVILAGGRRGGP
jgi:simple sugar transport system permease protein